MSLNIGDKVRITKGKGYKVTVSKTGKIQFEKVESEDKNMSKDKKQTFYISILGKGDITEGKLLTDGKIYTASVKRYFDDEYDRNVAACEVLKKLAIKSSKYKTGDKVRVVRNTCDHGVPIGKIITLKDVYDFSCGAIKWNHSYDYSYITESDFEPYTGKYYNGKVVCTRAYSDSFTKGKIYEIKNGILITNYGRNEALPFTCFDDLEKHTLSSFIEIKE